ncbi:ASB8, partial [Symbiodinium necroappetens]
MSTDKAAAFIGGIKVSKAGAMNHVPIRTVTYRASTQPALSSAPHQFADQLATKSELKKKEVLSILQNLSEIDASGVTATTGKPFDSFCKLMNVGFDAKASQKPATNGGVRMMFEAAPMALTALLITAAQRVQRCTDDPLQQSIFVDDRAAAVTTAEDAKMMWGTWYAAGPSGSSPLIAALRRATTPRLALKDQAREPPPEPVVGPQAEAARALLDLGASPLLNAADGTSALMLVAALDDEELLQRLLAAGTELDAVRGPSEALAVVGSQPQDWRTIDDLLMHMEGTSQPLPPSVLCPRGHSMERLCKSRCHRRPHCDSCRKQELHSSPVYWTCWPCDYDLCIDCARVPRLVQFREGFDPLAEDAAASLPEGTPEVLRSPSFLTTRMDGWTALHHAVVAGSEKSVRQLLERKADPALADARGLTPLHWAAFLANGAIQPLIECGAAVTALDHEGRPPLSLVPTEALRYAFLALEFEFKELCCHELRVVGSGPADGVYTQVKPSQPQAAQSSSPVEPAVQAASASAAEGAEPSDSPPPPPPAEEMGEAAAVSAEAGEAAGPGEAAGGGQADGAGEAGGAVATAAAAGVPPDEVVPVPSRPRYQRTDGVPFLIKWEEKNGWGLYQTAPGPAGAEACVFKSSKDTRYCPMDGWAPDERVQLEETPNVRVEEVAPYRWGILLFQATPAELWRPCLKEEVQALPELKQITSVSRIFIPGLPGMQISLSAAGGVEGMHQRALEMVMRGMDEPSCPVATATAGAQAGAIAELDEIRASVQNLPAFLFLVNVRRATFLLSQFRWRDAGDAFSDAVKVYRSVGRRALCPSLSLNSHLCYIRAGCEERAAEMLALCRSYREEKKKWSPLDRMSLRQAEAAHRQAQVNATSSSAGDEGGNPEAEPDEDEVPGSDQLGNTSWRPILLLYQKISCIYRGVNFMKPAAAQEFLHMVQEEAQKHEDADGRCMALCIQAEAMRQSEDWDEALRLAGEGVALQPELTMAGLKTGSLHFCHLVLAYSHYALGRPSLAQEALTKLSSLSVGDHFFQKQVEFKATHLRFLVGAEFEESYREISVAARSRERLVVEVPEGTSIQWDFILSNYTVDFVAMFTPATAKEGDAPQELQRVEQHQ